MQSTRLFEIIYILLNKKTVTARELAEHFSVSRRTVCRDIDALSAAGIPVYAERGKGGGIRLLSNFVLNKSILNEDEQTEILLALQGLSNVRTPDTQNILNKLTAIFNKTATNWLEVDYTGWHHEYDYFNDFKTAILCRRVVQFEYYNAYGEKTFRRIEPIQLWFKSRAWYLKGFCLTKQGMRLYKLSRVKNLLLTDEHFQPKNLTDEPNDSEQENIKNLITLKLHIQPELAYRVFDDFCDGMAEKQNDGSYIVTVKWTEDNWVYGYILSYGEYARVLEPAHLKEILANKIKIMSKNYS